jgi:hypothetical protein
MMAIQHRLFPTKEQEEAASLMAVPTSTRVLQANFAGIR